MSQQETVTVYSFRVFDSQAMTMALAPFQAERQRIVKGFGGEVLEGTGHEVPREALDRQGRYRRVATGWGELDD